MRTLLWCLLVFLIGGLSIVWVYIMARVTVIGIVRQLSGWKFRIEKKVSGWKFRIEKKNKGEK